MDKTPYVLFMYVDAQSFGEVAVLIDFANAIKHKYRCVFLSLTGPRLKAKAIAASGFSNLFLFNDEQELNEEAVQLLEENPPLCCIACDYSQFNVASDRNYFAAFGVDIMNRLQELFQTRCAVVDICGINFECKVPLKKIFKFVIVSVLSYGKVYLHHDEIAHPDTRLWTHELTKTGSLAGDAKSYDPSAATVFLSYRNPKEMYPEADASLVKLWCHCVDRALVRSANVLNVVIFEEIASFFSHRSNLVVLPGNISPNAVNDWLEKTDIIITSNPGSFLGARAIKYGSSAIVTYNSLAGQAFAESTQEFQYVRDFIDTPEKERAFEQWLPVEIESPWPGVTIDISKFLINIQAVPLVDTESMASYIRRKLPAAAAVTAKKLAGESAEAIICDLLR